RSPRELHSFPTRRSSDLVTGQIGRAVPEYADQIHEHVRALSDLTLLDVFAGCARRWAADGLLLIGDSAHTHSPIGAQGINLAVQDRKSTRLNSSHLGISY